MEQEQDTSIYRARAERYIYSGDLQKVRFARGSRFSNQSTSHAASKVVRNIVAAFYGMLDRIMGVQSILLLPTSRDTLLNAYQDVLRVLQSKKIISRVQAVEERFNDAPWFFRFDVTPAYPDGITDGSTRANATGYGFGKNEETTLSKSVGEFLERYFLTLYKKANLLRASLQSFPRRAQAVDLTLFAGFSDEQQRQDPSRIVTNNSSMGWEKVERISTGESYYVPAQFIYWNYKSEEGETFLRESNTNGAGGFFSREGALLSGLYELIHRDAFLIFWLNRIAPPKIDPGSIPSEHFQQLLKESKRYGFAVHCLDITSDLGVPSFSVIIEDTYGREPCIVVGASSGSHPALTLAHAFEEAWAVYHTVRPLSAYTLPKKYKPFSDRSLGRKTRLQLWSNKDMAKKFSFFLAGDVKRLSDRTYSFPRSFLNEKSELQTLVSIVERFGRGYEVYGFLHDHPILREVNYSVARVIVPQLVPLYLNENNVPLGAQRLYEVPKKLGYAPSGERNPLPHPFP